VERDIAVGDWLDLREVNAGEACPMCDAALTVDKTIEVGHIFKLGTRYSEAFGASVLDEHGTSQTIIMGSYGIGIERTMAAVVECCHDDAGIQWPLSVAPFEVVVTVIKPKDVAASEAGNALYDALVAEGIDVLLDDRDERPGVKFNDADLIGIPFRVTVGPKGLAEGTVELTRRATGRSRAIDLVKAARNVAETILEERAMSPQL
jgi:prolyl-tRNA synthetase